MRGQAKSLLSLYLPHADAPVGMAVGFYRTNGESVSQLSIRDRVCTPSCESPGNQLGFLDTFVRIALKAMSFDQPSDSGANII